MDCLCAACILVRPPVFLSGVAQMNYTPRTCPGPGDLWQLSWQEEKRQERYERLVENFFEKYIPRYCDERINELAEAGEDEKHPEIEPLFDEYLKENGWH